jgi:cellulose synthase/poly-beta-1,6-N-acetylglucosamine synthase-like glycosyltransferase
MTTATVVIATFNRADLLDDCLAHLSKQAFAEGDDVIIADNGSTDHTAAVVSRHARRFPTLLTRLVVPTPGKSHAVSAALQSARGDVVALTDDDVRVEKDWLVNLKRRFADPQTALAGGPVAPRWERPAPPWLRVTARQRLGAPLGLLDYGNSEARLGPRTLLGANMAVRRSVLQQLGGYAPHLGKLRGTLLSGEDHELCQRIQAAGYEAWYVPDARVAHWVPAARMRISYFVRWFYWSGITHASMDTASSSGRSVHRVPLYLVRQFAGGLASACAAALRGRLPAAVDRALDSAFAAGYAACRWGLTPTRSTTSASAARSA